MGTRVLHVVAFIVAIGCTVTGQQADGEIIAIQGWSGAGIEYGSGNGLNVGYDFTVGDTPILVTKLGVYDYGADGLGQSHDVGIWNVAVSSSTPLVSATVLSGTGSPAEGPVINNAGQFRFVELDSALALDANTTYRIGAYYGNTSDVHVRTPLGDTTVTWTTASEITYNGGRYRWISSVQCPTDATNRPFAYFGPNFQFVAVPEPCSLIGLLVGGGIAGVVLVLRRRPR